MHQKYIFLVPASLLVLGLAGATLRIMRHKPPETTMMEAGRMLSEAQVERAPDYAEAAYLDAGGYYDSAMMEWKNQNAKFIVFRNYNAVDAYAQKSIRHSEEAIQRARKAIADTADRLELRLEKSGDKITRFEKNFSRFPMDKEHRDAFTRCKLLYSESLQAYQSRDYTRSKTKLDSVEDSMNPIVAHYHGKLSDYFESYPHWEAIVEQSISFSKKNQVHVLVVDKIARELFVYKNGKILKQYPVELGANWVGDKMQQGDKTTPEGIYKIVEKKQNGQTSYHKAFLLNYPNDEDKHRFSLNKKNGRIRHDARIGNLIEIHGGGGRGTDWTDGCIALRDSDINELYTLCQAGTRVCIVGSTKPLNSIIFPSK